MSSFKTYLGDGAYAAWDGWNVTLTAEDGLRATDTIVLEPQVLDALFDFVMGLPGRTKPAGVRALGTALVLIQRQRDEARAALAALKPEPKP